MANGSHFTIFRAFGTGDSNLPATRVQVAEELLLVEGISTGVICKLPVSSLLMKYFLISNLTSASAGQGTHS
jgi:hypothetical protein